MGGATVVKVVQLRGGQRTEVTFDNRFVVPYCPQLLREFRAHLNVEVCATVKAIKYVVKYLMKGSDMAAFRLAREQGRDTANEIDMYLLGRYIGPMEAANTLFSFEVHNRYPPVVRLAVHLPDDEVVYFTADTAREAVERKKMSTLTAFFAVSLSHCVEFNVHFSVFIVRVFLCSCARRTSWHVGYCTLRCLAILCGIRAAGRGSGRVVARGLPSNRESSGQPTSAACTL
jgi:hypothetical protein